MKMLAALGLAVASAVTLGAQQSMPMSPRGSAAAHVSGTWTQAPNGEPRYANGKWITVDYGRPILRGRQNIFGAGADYGKKVADGAPLWRAGANQTTKLKTEVPLVIGGKTLAAGEYNVLVDLKENAWTLVLSTQPTQKQYDPNEKTLAWGAFNYDPKYDVLRAPMKNSKGKLSIDQFTIGFVNVSTTGGTLAMFWDTEIATVDFTVGSGS